MGGFHLFADVAKYGRTYNRPVERSGDGKPSVGSNSQSVSINEKNFSLNSYAKAVQATNHDKSGKYGTSDAGAEFCGGVNDCNIYKEAGNEACEFYLGRSEGFDDFGLRYMETLGLVGISTLGIKWKEFKTSKLVIWIDLVGRPLASWAPEVYKKLGGRWGSQRIYGMSPFNISYRNRDLSLIIATEFAILGAPKFESMEVNSESNPLERKDAEGPCLDESLENKEHLDVDSCDSDSPKNGDCGNVTTDDNEELRPVIVLEKRLHQCASHLHPGNDLNIALAESSGSVN
ncbi:hypothetical protein Tco_0828495 [Tanacetum coccineum]